MLVRVMMFSTMAIPSVVAAVSAFGSLLLQAVKTESKQEQSQTSLSFAEREQARPKVNASNTDKATIKREQSQARLCSAERE